MFQASKGHPGGHALRATGPQVRQVFLFSCLLPVAPHLPWAPVCRAPARGLLSEPSACAVGGRPGGRHSVLPSYKARSAQLLPDPMGHGHQRPASCASMEKSVPAIKPPKELKDGSTDSTWFAVNIAEQFWTGHRDGLANIRGAPASNVVPDAAAGWRGDRGERGPLPTSGSSLGPHAPLSGGARSALKLCK